MFRKLKVKLQRLAGAVGAYFDAKVQKWNEANRARIEREYPQLAFQELTPLEEAQIRSGYWGARW